jgi:hypothetical protein
VTVPVRAVVRQAEARAAEERLLAAMGGMTLQEEERATEEQRPHVEGWVRRSVPERIPAKEARLPDPAWAGTGSDPWSTEPGCSRSHGTASGAWQRPWWLAAPPPHCRCHHRTCWQQGQQQMTCVAALHGSATHNKSNTLCISSSNWK